MHVLCVALILVYCRMQVRERLCVSPAFHVADTAMEPKDIVARYLRKTELGIHRADNKKEISASIRTSLEGPHGSHTEIVECFSIFAQSSVRHPPCIVDADVGRIPLA